MAMGKLRATGLVLVAALVLGAAPPEDFDAAGFRSARYRSPVTIDPAPSHRIALPAALQLADAGMVQFLDVMPVESGVRDAATGRWQMADRHETIPGAEWHPETGRSPVDAALFAALERSIARDRARRPGRLAVVFCRADCWMSWNAARRLSQAGVDDVWWLAEGTDGWHAAGRPLVTATPIAVPQR